MEELVLDFKLSDDLLQMKETIRHFVENEVEPHAMEIEGK